MIVTQKQTEIDLNDRLTLEQAEYQYSVAKNEGKFDLLALAKDLRGYQVFKCFPQSLIERIGFTIINKNVIVK